MECLSRPGASGLFGPSAPYGPIKNINAMNKEELKREIRQLCRDKQAVILAHYYTRPEIQDTADFIGDSLALARKAAETDARIIVMCGVHFMAETCKLLCPDRTVLCPDPEAGCSLADSCTAEELRRFKAGHPGHTVISYVNTTAAVKALTDIVVTSGNAERIVRQLPQDEKIIFGPDRNLGSYINAVTGRRMLLWQGGCHVHARFTPEAITTLKAKHPEATVMAHLECSPSVLALADIKGSTATMLAYAKEHPLQTYIVATEAGILHEMQRQCPGTAFLPVPPEGVGTPCNECEYMRLNTLEKLYRCLRDEAPAIEVPEDIAREAVKPIKRMLELS